MDLDTFQKEAQSAYERKWLEYQPGVWAVKTPRGGNRNPGQIGTEIVLTGNGLNTPASVAAMARIVGESFALKFANIQARHRKLLWPAPIKVVREGDNVLVTMKLEDAP